MSTLGWSMQASIEWNKAARVFGILEFSARAVWDEMLNSC